jgi:hypothetical protein
VRGSDRGRVEGEKDEEKNTRRRRRGKKKYIGRSLWDVVGRRVAYSRRRPK